VFYSVNQKLKDDRSDWAIIYDEKIKMEAFYSVSEKREERWK
jgi:hypothetical protein